VLSFDASELGTVITTREREAMLASHGGVDEGGGILALDSAVLAREFEARIEKEREVRGGRIEGLLDGGSGGVQSSIPGNAVVAVMPERRGHTVQEISAGQKVSSTATGKKRITPMFLRGLSGDSGAVVCIF
jgi:hypothetical protein